MPGRKMSVFSCRKTGEGCNMTDLMEAMQKRHSVRSFLPMRIEKEKIAEIEREIKKCNFDGDLHIELKINDPTAFSGFLARFGRFKNVANYLIIAGPESENLDERAGYFGEQIVLRAVMLGLNCCWVGLTFGKGKVKPQLAAGDRLVCVIALGYGEKQGVPHKSKPVAEVCEVTESEVPIWFSRGIEYALLAPTALNQQKFIFKYDDGEVTARTQKGSFANVDLGIAEYHFDTAAEKSFFYRKLTRK